METYSKTSEQDTKTRIFLTAAQLFANEGYDRVSIRQICEAVGVGKPTLYYYFKDKETLLRELIQYSFTLGEKLIKKHFDCKKNFFDKLRGIIEGRKAFILQYPTFVRFFYMLHLQPIPKNILEDMGKIAHNHYNRLIAFLEEGQKNGFIDSQMDIPILANTLVGTLNQLFFRYSFMNDKKAMTEKTLNKLYNFWQNHLFHTPTH